MPNLFPNFLKEDSEYAQAEAYWESLWNAIPESDRLQGGWRSGWLTPQSLKDGNPIFTAISDSQQKAIRVIQYEPENGGTEFDSWIDTFGGSPVESSAITELVIACALSDDSARLALEFMSSWIVGEIEFLQQAEPTYGNAQIRGARPRWQEPNFNPKVRTQPASNNEIIPIAGLMVSAE